MSRPKRLWALALAAGALAGFGAGPAQVLAASSSASQAVSPRALSAPCQGTPDQVINSKTDPQKVGQVLNPISATIQYCKWDDTQPITTGWGSEKSIGDAVYNCNKVGGPDAETAIGVREERGEATSVSETASLKVSLGFLGLAKASTEFEAFSRQSAEFSTSVETESQVTVPPMQKGWNVYQVFSAFVSGNAYVTDGIHLIEVSGIDLTFPGYQPPPGNPNTQVRYGGIKEDMTQADIATRCGAITGVGGRLGARPAGFTITLCHATHHCTTRRVTGSTPPPHNSKGPARLSHGGLTYATGSASRAGIRLTMQRPIHAGNYKLTIEEPHNITDIMHVSIA
jgi:hypothetical protein